jgi:hypothetical protein
MDTIGSDVFSKYPLLSQKLRNAYLSKQVYEDTLRGACDIPISNYDILNVILPLFQQYKQRVIFLGSSPNDNREKALSAWIINKLPFYNGKMNQTLVLFQNDMMFERVGIYQSIGSIGGGMTDYTTWSNIITNRFNDGRSTYFDVLTIRDYYATRLQCKFENYVNNKTLEYFNDVVSELQSHDINLELHLYLSINCYILGIHFDYENISLTYDKYADYEPRIEVINNMLIEKITNHIKNL